eukprot:6885628-Pyramimonas_sp.AAC.1
MPWLLEGAGNTTPKPPHPRRIAAWSPRDAAFPLHLSNPIHLCYPCEYRLTDPIPSGVAWAPLADFPP